MHAVRLLQFNRARALPRTAEHRLELAPDANDQRVGYVAACDNTGIQTRDADLDGVGVNGDPGLVYKRLRSILCISAEQCRPNQRYIFQIPGPQLPNILSGIHGQFGGLWFTCTNPSRVSR